jgi:hypothetical protein
MDEVRNCLGKTMDGAVRLALCLFRQNEQLGKGWNIGCRREEVVVVVGKIWEVGL